MKIYGALSEEVRPLYDYNKPHLDKYGIPYEFKELDLEREGRSHFLTYKFGLCMLKRSEYWMEVMEKTEDGGIIIFTDLDVIPLGDYRTLLPWISDVDLCFMRETKSRTASINCGFILLRKTPDVMDLFNDWIKRCRWTFSKKNYLNEQKVMSQRLRAKKFNYKTFTHRIVSREPYLVFKETIAYHAINVGRDIPVDGVDTQGWVSKIGAMEKARLKSERVK